MTPSSIHATFAWRAHPARRRPAAAAGAGAVILLAAGAVWFSFGLPWAVGSIVLLIAGLNRFFFPSRFELDEQGITARYPLRRQRLRWADLRRFAHDQYGGYLSTRARSSRMDAYSGMHVLFDEHRQTAIEAIRSRMKQSSVVAVHSPQPTAPAGGRSCPG